MAILFALGIALAVVIFITLPFLLPPDRFRRERSVESSTELRDLIAEKESIYAAIQELEFDYKSGKLSSEDYAGLRTRQEERAARVLQHIDTLQASPASKSRKR